jgi:putative transposase
MLRYKAEEAGSRYEELPTQQLAPTQRCYLCWKKAKKELEERVHRCSCGANCSRDENAGRVMMRALKELLIASPLTNKTGLESGRAEVFAYSKLCETPSIPLG